MIACVAALRRQEKRTAPAPWVPDTSSSAADHNYPVSTEGLASVEVHIEGCLGTKSGRRKDLSIQAQRPELSSW